ncbi:MAG: DUF3726 domain-containing protein [Pseudomonadota bacterium]
MTLSLNEVEALAKKAARGAGYSWGMAEEAGRATRWLCAHDVDGVLALAHLLKQLDGIEFTDFSPIIGEIWCARGAHLCPISAGATMSDRAGVLRDHPVHMQAVLQPVLLGAFAGQVAMHLGEVVTVTWNQTVLATDGHTQSVTGETHQPLANAAISVGGRMGQCQVGKTRADPDTTGLEILNRFAHRTYAPATEESRLKGAGAGIADND